MGEDEEKARIRASLVAKTMEGNGSKSQINILKENFRGSVSRNELPRAKNALHALPKTEQEQLDKVGYYRLLIKAEELEIIDSINKASDRPDDIAV